MTAIRCLLPLLLFCVLLPHVAQANAFAQDLPDWAAPPARQGPMEAAQPPGLPGEPTPVPINGALALLALAGGAFGIRRLRCEDA